MTLSDRLQRCQADLEASEARTRNLITLSADGILMVNASGVVEYMNSAAEGLLGYAADELVGRPFEFPVAGEAGDDAVELDVQLPRSDGRRVFVQMRVEDTVWRSGNSDRHPARMVVLRDITERKQREREHEAVATVAHVLRDVTSRDELLFPDLVAAVLDQVLRCVQASGAALVRRDPRTYESACELGRGDLSHWTGLSRLPEDGAIGRVLATGKLYVSHDARADPELSGLDFTDRATSVAIAPMIVSSQCVGALVVSRTGRIDDEATRLLAAIADMVSGAILRATLHDRNEYALRRLSALHNIDLAITGTLDLGVTLSVLLGQTLTQLGVDAAAVFRLNPRTQMLEYVAGRGLNSDAVSRLRMRLGEGAAGIAALERRQVVTRFYPGEWGDSDLDGTGARNTGNRNELSASVARLFPRAQSAVERERFVEIEQLAVYYSVPLVAKGQVTGVLEIYHRSPLNPDAEWLSFLDALAVQAAIAIDHAELVDSLRRLNIELTLAYDTTLEGWARALELRDDQTEGHTQRVTHMAEQLARFMGMDEEALVHLRRGAILHDIGKMVISDTVLKKPGPLSEEEWATMRQHPLHAYELLYPILYLRPALDIPYCHHEKWDGTGYPRGLKGEQIPMPARIFAVVDVWDALRSERPYHEAWPVEQAQEHLRAEAGRSFDPIVVDQFLKMIDEQGLPG